jgi:hypothetical protein
MLDEATRTTILKLHEAGHGIRAIAKALGVGRASVTHQHAPPVKDVWLYPLNRAFRELLTA